MIIFKFRYLFLFFLILIESSVFSQIQNIQVNQLPIQLNPSLAGAKGKSRVCISTSTLTFKDSVSYNLGFSYDKVLKKVGGVAVYGGFSNQNIGKQDTIILNNLQKYANPKQSLGFNQYLQVGIAYAPKFNMLNRNNPNNIKYSFSPSLFLEYGNHTYHESSNIYIIEFYHLIYNENFPQGQKNTDSINTYYYYNRFKAHYLKYGLGLNLNSKKLILLYKLQFANGIAPEKNDYYRENLTTHNRLLFSSNQKTYHSFIIQNNCHAGYSFEINDKFSITPFAGIGNQWYTNIDKNLSNFNDIESTFLQSNQSRQIFYKHASLSLKISNFLIGYTYTAYNSQAYKGFSAGFQNKSIKILALYGSNKHQKQIEIGLQWLR